MTEDEKNFLCVNLNYLREYLEKINEHILHAAPKYLNLIDDIIHFVDPNPKITFKAKIFSYTEENPHPIYGPCTANFDGIPCVLTESGFRTFTENEINEWIEKSVEFKKTIEELETQSEKMEE